MMYFLKASAVLALFFVGYKLFLQRETFFQSNRWFLLLGLVVALIFPLIVIPEYVYVEPTPVVASELFLPIQNVVMPQVTEVNEPIDWLQLIYYIYGIGFGLFFIQFLLQFVGLIVLLLRNPKNKEGIYTYVLVKNKIAPFSFFKWIVYNPENYETEELQLILTHEKVHVDQMHSLDIIVSQLACAVFWWNPIVWFYRQSIRQNLEYIADSNTQKQSQNHKTYQHLLLKTGVSNYHSMLSNNFFNSQIKNRIVMLNKSKSNVKKKWRYLLILPLLGGLLLSMNTEKVFVTTEHPQDDTHLVNNIEKPIPLDDSEIEIKITKTTTDAQLEEIKKKLKAKDVEMTIKRIKRNSNDEITDLSIDFKTSNRSSSYKVNDTNGIEPFYFSVDDDGDFYVGNKDKHGNRIKVHKYGTSKGKVHKIHIDGDTDVEVHVEEYVIEGNDDEDERIEEIIINNGPDSIHKYKYVLKNAHVLNDSIKSFSYVVNGKGSSNVQVYQIDEDSLYLNKGNNVKILSTDGDSDAIIKVNGRTIKIADSDEIIDLVGGAVSSSSVKVYEYDDDDELEEIIVNGNRITTKSKNVYKLHNNGYNKVNDILVIDHDDVSKNAFLSYITKNTTDAELKGYKAKMKAAGITMKYSKLRRNKSGEITSLKISLKNDKGSSTESTWKSSDGISKIKIGEVGGTLIASSVN